MMNSISKKKKLKAFSQTKKKDDSNKSEVKKRNIANDIVEMQRIIRDYYE